MSYELVFIGGPQDGQIKTLDDIPERHRAELAPAPVSPGPITELPPRSKPIETVNYHKFELVGQNASHWLMVIEGMDGDDVIRKLINTYSTRPKQTMPSGLAAKACNCPVN